MRKTERVSTTLGVEASLHDVCFQQNMARLLRVLSLEASFLEDVVSARNPMLWARASASVHPLRVQVPKYKSSTRNHNHDSEYRKPKYPPYLGTLDP